MYKGISQRAYARRLGVSHTAVQKAIKDGRISTNSFGRIDPMRANIGEDIRNLKDVLGHTKITTTEIYAHTANQRVRQTATNTAAAILG